MGAGGDSEHGARELPVEEGLETHDGEAMMEND